VRNVSKKKGTKSKACRPHFIEGEGENVKKGFSVPFGEVGGVHLKDWGGPSALKITKQKLEGKNLDIRFMAQEAPRERNVDTYSGRREEPSICEHRNACVGLKHLKRIKQKAWMIATKKSDSVQQGFSKGGKVFM